MRTVSPAYKRATCSWSAAREKPSARIIAQALQLVLLRRGRTTCSRCGVRANRHVAQTGQRICSASARAWCFATFAQEDCGLRGRVQRCCKTEPVGWYGAYSCVKSPAPGASLRRNQANIIVPCCKPSNVVSAHAALGGTFTGWSLRPSRWAPRHHAWERPPVRPQRRALIWHAFGARATSVTRVQTGVNWSPPQ